MTRSKQLLATLLSIVLVTSIGLVATGGFVGAQSQEGTASVTIEDQPSDGQTVIVDEVTLPEGGFVVIHDTEQLEDGEVVESVIGVSSYLEAGSHEDVPVTMAQELDTTEVDVTAMAHMDTNGNEVYDFVTSDGELDGAYTAGDGAEETETETEMTETETEETPSAETETEETETAMTETEEETTIGEETEGETTIGEETTEETEIGETPAEEMTTTEEAAASFQVETETTEPGMTETETEEETTIGEETPEETETTEETETEEEETETETEAETETEEETTEEAEPGGPVVDTATIDAVGDGVPATNLNVSDQSSDGTTVTVDRVTLYRGGYVVIHDAEELEDGDAIDSVIGNSEYLPPGTYEDVEVTLAEPVDVENESSVNVTAMPHHETNHNLVFDFVMSLGSNDDPYLDENETPVTATAAVSGEAEATETPEETETEAEETPEETETEEETTEAGTETETEETEPGMTETEEETTIGEETETATEAAGETTTEAGA